MNTQALAQQFDLDQSSIDSFLTFMVDNIKREPKLLEFLKTDPDACMKVGIKKWLKMSTEVCNELIAGETDFAKKFRDDIWEINNQSIVDVVEVPDEL